MGQIIGRGNLRPPLIPYYEIYENKVATRLAKKCHLWGLNIYYHVYRRPLGVFKNM